jgi:hypothetical protein
MNNETDEYGVWEVTNGDGCISRVNIEPTQKYKDENPQLFQIPIPTETERIEAIETAISALMGV